MVGDRELTDAEHEYIEAMGRYFENYGYPRIGGRLVGLLSITDRPLSIDEMASLLLVSRASISTNARRMSAASLLRRVSLPGDRRDYYEFAYNDWTWAVAASLQGAQRWRGILVQGLAALDAEDQAARERLEEGVAFFDFLTVEMAGIMDRWREQRAACRAAEAGSRKE